MSSKNIICKITIYKLNNNLENIMNKKPVSLTKKKISTNKTLTDVTIKLPKDWVEHLNYLEKTTSKSKNYYVKESLGRYLEDLEDYQIATKILKNKSKTYTSERANQRLAELSAKYHKSTPKHV